MNIIMRAVTYLFFLLKAGPNLFEYLDYFLFFNVYLIILIFDFFSSRSERCVFADKIAVPSHIIGLNHHKFFIQFKGKQIILIC